MDEMPPDANVVLIGMPGAGKSTVGVLLAKILARRFIDTDLLIQTRERAPLQRLIDTLGPAGFCDLEADVVLGVTECRAVIATGGSVVYRQRAVDHLRARGLVIHLETGLATLTARLTDMDRRGVVLPRQRGLADLYAERLPLYRQAAHCVVVCDGLDHNQVVTAVMRVIAMDGSCPGVTA